MLDLAKIRAITLDLDDTLWPIWPVIERAEGALASWLRIHAPRTARVFSDTSQRFRLREHVVKTRPDIGHDMSALRLEVIRQALQNSAEDTALAAPAFEVFFEARMKVDLFDDAVPALEFLAKRFPLVALSNGNADVNRVGIGHFFHGSVSAHQFGIGKPDPRIFHAAAQSAQCASDEVLHIGDDLALDVQGALAAGMQAVWLNRNDQPLPLGARPQLTVSSLAQVVEVLRRE